MRLYYFIHITGRDPAKSGIGQVVRGLGRALGEDGAIEILPVRWSAEAGGLVHAEPLFLETIAGEGGPAFPAPDSAGESIVPGPAEGDWLLVPEVPHLVTSDPRYPSVALAEVFAAARRHGLRCAALVHDLLPLTQPGLCEGGEALQRRFAAYAEALLDADLLLPVSQASAADFADWCEVAGHRPDVRPRIAPVLVPEEIALRPRRIPDAAAPLAADAIRFVSFGRVCRRNNPLLLIEAFSRVSLRRPELPLLLDIVGHCEPEMVAPFSRAIGRAAARVRVCGYLDDARLFRLVTAARATISVPLAGGHGLPVAESLWLGTPSLCSNTGPAAEIASGGGCVTVDPRDGAAIAAAIEGLASDEDGHRRLRAELAERRLRSWADYGAAVLGELGGLGAGEALAPPRLVSFPHRAPRSRARSAFSALSCDEVTMTDHSPAFERWFMIAAAELSCHDAYILDGKNRLRQEDAIAFDARRDGEVAEEVLFYGPYISVDPGIYLFQFEGELDGPLQLRLAHAGGKRLQELTIDSFGPLLCVVLTSRFDHFEVVGVRTPELKLLRLEAISVHYIDPTREAEGEDPDDSAAAGAVVAG